MLHARAGISDSDCGTQIVVALPCCCCCYYCCWILAAFWPSLAFGQNFVCCTRRGPTKMLTSSCPAFLVNSFLVLALATLSASGRLIAKVVDRLLSVRGQTDGHPSILCISCKNARGGRGEGLCMPRAYPNKAKIRRAYQLITALPAQAAQQDDSLYFRTKSESLHGMRRSLHTRAATLAAQQRRRVDFVPASRQHAEEEADAAATVATLLLTYALWRSQCECCCSDVEVNDNSDADCDVDSNDFGCSDLDLLLINILRLSSVCRWHRAQLDVPSHWVEPCARAALTANSVLESLCVCMSVYVRVTLNGANCAASDVRAACCILPAIQKWFMLNTNKIRLSKTR